MWLWLHNFDEFAVKTGKAEKPTKGSGGGWYWPVKHGLDFVGICLYTLL